MSLVDMEVKFPSCFCMVPLTEPAECDFNPRIQEGVFKEPFGLGTPGSCGHVGHKKCIIKYSYESMFTANHVQDNVNSIEGIDLSQLPRTGPVFHAQTVTTQQIKDYFFVTCPICKKPGGVDWQGKLPTIVLTETTIPMYEAFVKAGPQRVLDELVASIGNTTNWSQATIQTKALEMAAVSNNFRKGYEEKLRLVEQKMLSDQEEIAQERVTFINKCGFLQNQLEGKSVEVSSYNWLKKLIAKEKVEHGAVLASKLMGQFTQSLEALHITNETLHEEKKQMLKKIEDQKKKIAAQADRDELKKKLEESTKAANDARAQLVELGVSFKRREEEHDRKVQEDADLIKCLKHDTAKWRNLYELQNKKREDMVKNMDKVMGEFQLKMKRARGDDEEQAGSSKGSKGSKRKSH